MIDNALAEALRQELYAKDVRVIPTDTQVKIVVICNDGKGKEVTFHHSELWGFEDKWDRFRFIANAWRNKHNILDC